MGNGRRTILTILGLFEMELDFFCRCHFQLPETYLYNLQIRFFLVAACLFIHSLTYYSLTT
jgi:hypothetical protein